VTAGLIVNPFRAKSVSVIADVSGNASGSITGVVGEIVGVHVALGTGMTTADVTVTTDGSEKILDDVTVTASKLYGVRATAVSNDGSTSITDSFIPYVNMGGTMAVAVESATTTKSLTVTVLYR